MDANVISMNSAQPAKSGAGGGYAYPKPSSNTASTLSGSTKRESARITITASRPKGK